MRQDHTAQRILKRLSELKHDSQEEAAAEALTAYEEFEVDEKTYYFTPGGFLYRREPGTEEVGGFFCGYLSGEAPGGFLYRREPGTEEVGGFFCGYLSGEAWRYRTDNG